MQEMQRTPNKKPHLLTKYENNSRKMTEKNNKEVNQNVHSVFKMGKKL